MLTWFATVAKDPATFTKAEKISVVLNGQAGLWTIAFTFAWDLVDLWLRDASFKFLKARAFWIYFIFHALLSILATLGLAKTFANEMVLSNANITFGKASRLPLLDQFQALRVVRQNKIDELTVSETNQRIEKLAAWPMPTLLGKWTALLV